MAPTLSCRIVSLALVTLAAATTTVRPQAVQQGTTVTTMEVKTRGGSSPLSGNWEWISKIGRNEVRLKVKIDGAKLTGNWIDPSEPKAYLSGMFSLPTLTDGQVRGVGTISFRRCYGPVNDSDQYFGTPQIFDTFKKCDRDASGKLKSNQTIVEYVGTINGDRLELRATSHVPPSASLTERAAPKTAPAPEAVIDRAGSRVGDPSMLMARTVSSSLPEPSTLIKQLWSGGQWRTIRYVAEGFTVFENSPMIRSTVVFEKPDRVKIEMEVLAGKGAGRILTATSDGSVTWLYNATNKQYAKLSMTAGELLLSLDEIMLRQLPDANNIGQEGVGRITDLFASFRELTDPLLASGWASLSTLRSEPIRVDGSEHSSWVVTGTRNVSPQWNTRIIWIDKDLQIPLRSGMLRSALTNASDEKFPLFAQPHFYEMRVVSLEVDGVIFAPTFTFHPPNETTEVIAPRR